MEASELKFLVVDDNDSARAMVCEYLRSYGYTQIREAHRIKEALDVIHSESIDCIISDWDLPGASGITLLRLIKSQKKYNGVVMILLSGIQEHEESKVRRARQLKVDGYLLKPFRAAKLSELLNQVLLPK